jgi:glycosyltransferase involved in cell wall biosynthesis
MTLMNGSRLARREPEELSMFLSLAIASLFLLLAGLWPFGPYQLTLMIARKLHPFPPLAARTTANTASIETFAICLCVYNERAVIREKIKDLLRLRAADNGNLQILVYVDCSDDGTAEVLENYRDQIGLVISQRRQGKTFGMNLLISRTTADIVMFTDANVLIQPDATTVLRRYFADSKIGCVCSDLTYLNPDDSATARIGARYWRMNEWSKSLETDTGSVIGADGSLFAIRRALHRPVPNGLFDDIYVSLGVLLQGRRVVRAPELRAFETHATEAGDEFRRKVRIACECMHVHFILWPELRRLDAWNVYKYIGHRLLRWIGAYLLGLAALFAMAAIWTIAGPFWAIGMPLAMAFGVWMSVLTGIGPGLILWNILLAFAGNAVGVWRALRGQRSVTWNAPASARRRALITPPGRDSV